MINLIKKKLFNFFIYFFNFEVVNSFWNIFIFSILHKKYKTHKNYKVLEKNYIECIK